MITKFKIFENYSEKEEYSLLILEFLINGDLKISLTKEGKNEVRDYGIDVWKFYDYFEDIYGNSDYLYTEDLGAMEIINANFMTSSPAIIDGIGYGEDEKYKIFDDTKIYWYPNYMISDFTDELVNNGYVIFKNNEPRTKEEIEKYKLKKDTQKYNL